MEFNESSSKDAVSPASDQADNRHHTDDRPRVGCGVITVSDTRTRADDRSGAEIERLLLEAGHRVVDRRIVPDASEQLRQAVLTASADPRIDAVLITGGTGIAPRDQTPEVLEPLLEVQLPGFGELFRAVSFAAIGPAAMLSRAVAGRRGRTVVFAMPGSTNAVRTAVEQLILPVLTHAVAQAQQN
ncbi:MogA/MoaB family molybdenum cofactor biosynthesis protein [Candidatus Laterigemmans baculatus]|uniref:MogA/MoaB family molybdenum cofactor biosynthesis protein n=1 Tax=Candidatus Laterigemmans baculatus TaxID=2770505 RepID=UPI0013D97DF2|nr:MogA/MoaB family molybdenum cofactor biosynthesis protein [Candidatus Laterigemmans baculatus]